MKKKKHKCLNCGRELMPYLYTKKDGFPKLIGKHNGYTYRCKCSGKDLIISIG